MKPKRRNLFLTAIFFAFSAAVCPAANTLTIQALDPDLNGDLTLGDDIAGNLALVDFPGVDSIVTAGQVGVLLGAGNLSLSVVNTVTVSSSISWASGSSLTLNAAGVNVNSGISALAGSVVATGTSFSLAANISAVTLDISGITSDSSLPLSNLTVANLIGGGNDTIVGTGGNDVVSLTGVNAGSIGGVAFTGISTIDAAAGSDTVNTNATVLLTGVANQLTSNGITASNVEILGGTNTAITGAGTNETFNLTAAGAGNVAGIGFTGISTIDAAAGSDTVNTNATVLLTGVANQLTSNGITASNVEILGGTNTAITGAGTNEIINYNGANAGNVAGITFSGISTFDAAAGNDVVNTNASVSLTGVGSQFISNGITTTNVETVNLTGGGVNGQLNGTTGPDIFNLTGDQSGNVVGLNFTGVNTINAGDGADILNFGATQAGGLDFNGQGGIDTVNITANVTLTTDNIDAEFLNVGANTVGLTGNNLVDTIAVDNTGGTFNINGSETVGTYTQSGPASLLGGGSILTATTATLNGGSVTGNLTGTTSITSTGTVGISGNLAGGSLLVTGGTLTFSGSSTNNLVNISSLATLIDTGNLSNTAVVTNAGTFTVNGADTIGSLANNAGTVNGTSNLTVGGATTFNGGTLSAPLTVNGNGGGSFTGATIAGTFNGTTLLDGSTVTGAVNGNTTTTNAVTVSGVLGGGSLSVVSGLLSLTGLSTNSTVSIFSGSTLNNLNRTGGFGAASSVTNNGTLVLNGSDTVTNLTNNGKIQIDSQVAGGGDLGFLATGQVVLGSNSTLLLSNSTLGIGQIYDVFDGAVTGSFAVNGISAVGGPNLRYSFNSVTGSIQALPGLVRSDKSANTIYNLNANQTETIGSLFEDSHNSLAGETNFRRVYFAGPGLTANIVPGPTQYFVLDLDPGTGTSANPALAQLVTAITQVQSTYTLDSNGNVIVGAAGINTVNQLSPEVHRGMVDYTEQALRAHVRDGVNAAPISQNGDTQVFATLSGTYGGAESNGTNADYDISMVGMTTGIRHDVDKALQLGAILGVDDGTIDGALIDTDAQGIMFGVFGNYMADEASKTLLTSSLSYGVYEYEAARRTFAGTKAKADGIDSDALELAIGLSTVAYEKDNFRIRPNAGVRYLTGSVDGFTESGTGVNLAVESQDLDSLLLELGVSFEYDIQENIFLFGHLGYVTDFEDSDNKVSASFAAAGAAGREFGVNAPGIDDEALVIGLGGYYDINLSTRVGLNYRGELRSASSSSHTIGIGASFGF